MTDDTIEWVGLDPKARILFYLQAFSRLALFWAPVTVGGVAAASFGVGLLYAALGGAAWMFVLFIMALWIPALAWERWAYAIRDEDLLIARGVLVHTVTAIPLARIQHVDTRQGPLEQWMDLSRVQIHTASGVGEDGMIPGLTLADAESLRDVLIQVSGDDGV